MTKAQIKQPFKDFKIQLSDGTYEMIEDHLKREVKRMALRCKGGNLKRLTPELFYVALGNLGGK